MNEEYRETAKIRTHPALLFFGCLVAGYLADRVVPVQLLPDDFPSTWISVLMFVLSFLLGGWSFREYARCQTPVDPQFPAENLVTTGPCRFSRNPFYLALIILQTGFAILVNSLWMSAATVVLFVLLHFTVIIPEETYLTTRFGQDYLDYRARVRRWL